MFYSKSTGGFYSHDVHGDNMPADVVEITIALHAELMRAQSEGKQIKANANGFPVAMLPPAPTPTEIIADKNNQARAALAAINTASASAMLTWIAKQSDAGPFLKQQEALAVAERMKLV